MSTRKRITELSVAELRSQLVKRGVDAAGDRPSLVAKLKKVCTDSPQNDLSKPQDRDGVGIGKMRNCGMRNAESKMRNPKMWKGLRNGG